MNTEQKIEGFILLDKPKDISSYGCIAKLKRLLPHKTKIGHAGTLDELATGLLIIAIGRDATKKLTGLIGLDKRYEATGTLGQVFDTSDNTGTITKKRDPSHITKKDLETMLLSFGNAYEQTPPIYSALKYNGLPLYRWAREKRMSDEELYKIAKVKAKMVRLNDLALKSFELPNFTIEVHVSSGTYIRTLVSDIGDRLGTGATTCELRRTAIGPYQVSAATTLESLRCLEDIRERLLMPHALRHPTSR